MDRPGRGACGGGPCRGWAWRQRVAALAVVGALGLAGCGGGDGGDGGGGGGAEPAATSTSVPADVQQFLDDVTKSFGPERSAQIAAAVNSAIQAVIQAATTRVANPMTPEEMDALFRAKMAEAGVPLP